ncbi:MAG: gliding motility-associated C-terminal domain-containing protein, partial [Chitinophagaceae bacterium]|nr:gliding motility-associated C-terminal domain-containing protein [Chitinophagaceae bacterium]
ALDAASVVEDGRTAGILLDSVTIEPPCGKRSSGTLQLHAFSATPGPLTFTMDGRSNTTGYFDAVSAGAHAVRISNAIGCVVDTSIVVGSGLSTQFVVTKKDVGSCTLPDGELSLSGVTTSYFPVTYSINGGPYGLQSHFFALGEGQHELSIRDGAGCQIDTIISIGSAQPAPPKIEVSVAAASCNKPNGKVNIVVSGSDGPYTINYDGRSYAQNENTFADLQEGSHEFSISGATDCSWDTTVIVPGLAVSAVQRRIKTTNPTCAFPEGGELIIDVEGSQGPYQLDYGSRVFASGSAITGLTAGTYAVNIINKDRCIVESVQAVLTIGEDPSCEELIMPNAFTPNGDGINETIRPVHSPLIREMRCDIFNRYGQRMYSYNGRGSGWDGNFGGKPQPAGNYIWSARYVSNRGEVITRKGSFMLIR